MIIDHDDLIFLDYSLYSDEEEEDDEDVIILFLAAAAENHHRSSCYVPDVAKMNPWHSITSIAWNIAHS